MTGQRPHSTSNQLTKLFTNTFTESKNSGEWSAYPSYRSIMSFIDLITNKIEQTLLRSSNLKRPEERVDVQLIHITCHFVDSLRRRLIASSKNAKYVLQANLKLLFTNFKDFLSTLLLFKIFLLKEKSIA